jgi:cytochrome P450
VVSVLTRKVVLLGRGEGLGAYHVPAGEYVGAVITPMTRDERRFPEPDRYHPDRYLDAPPPLDLLFGRGAFSCVAQEFSRILVATALSGLFRQFQMKLTAPAQDRICRVHLTCPTRTIPVLLHRRCS